MPPTKTKKPTSDESFRDRQSPKFESKRRELAEAALQTLADLGYARTSLREIAQNSDYSHGVLHYYFADKAELIMYCVRAYKAACVQRYDEIVSTATSPHDLERRFAAGMSATMRDEAKMHRLWYDLRSQSLYEATFKSDVDEIDASLEQMIWRIVTRHSELSGRAPGVGSKLAYAMFDGAFQHALRSHLGGERGASSVLEDQIIHLLRAIGGASAVRDSDEIVARRKAR